MTTFDVSPEQRASASSLLKRQLFRQPPVASRAEVDLSGKTAIVTGSNIGIGLECSRQLLDLGLSKLIIAVRNEPKGEAARKELLSGRTDGAHTIEVWKLDLSLYESVTAFVERTKGLDRLDIVVLNAGQASITRKINQSTGHDECIQVNYLSNALLAILLLPVLKAKNSPQRPGRLAVVNSDTSSWAAFKEKDSVPLLPAFDTPEFFDQSDRYSTSKLLCQLFLSELTKRVPPSVAIINAPNPGMCYGSGLNRDADGTLLGVFLRIVWRLLGRSTSVGARAVTDAVVKHGAETHGQYLEDGKLNPMAPIVYKPQGARIANQLWQETMEELEFARVGDIVSGLSGPS
ncbi:retinol dehydrogenase 12 [Xylariaceae sp. FL0662B]|nr:retinol dehydrogenase 12 [Xylariaceae sp. FL0662B]